MATLYGLGVGPGDPDLITLKALKILQAAPVIAFPATTSGESMARAIAAPHIPEGRIELPFAIDIRTAHDANEGHYDSGAEAVAAHLRAGRDVAVLCEGDPFLYGSFMYLFARLAEDWPVRIVPGISSLNAAAAALAHPLVSGNETLTLIPATLPEDQLTARLKACEAAAILKVGRHLPKLKRALTAAGLMERASYVERVGFPEQRQCALADLTADAAPYFSIVLARRAADPIR